VAGCIDRLACRASRIARKNRLSMSTHDERLRAIEWAWKSRRSQLPRGALPRWESPKAAKRELNRKFKTAVAQIQATLGGGAGQLLDEEIRHFFNEFNTRLFEHGPHVMPSSFNVLEAFVRYDEDLNFFRLLPERDHLFSFSDFVDFVTSKDAPEDPFTAGYGLQEDTIYSYSILDDPHDLTFSTGSGEEFAVAGVSMVRSSDEIAMMLLAGKVADLESQQDLVEAEGMQASRGHEVIRPDPDRARRAEPVGEHEDLWKTVVLVRFDLKARTELVHYILIDIGNAYTGFLDDPEGLPGSPREGRSILAESRLRLNEHAVLFEICKSAIELPAYFAFKYTLVRDEPVEPLSTGGPASRAHPSRPRFGRNSGRVVYKHISALRVIGAASRTARRFTAPRFRVEVDGFWRQLGPGHTGRGPANEVVEGRTWVHGHLRWRDLPEKPIEVLVKSRLAIARATVEAEDLLRRVGSAAAEVDTPPEQVLEPAAPVSREDAYRERRLLTTRLRWKILQRDDFRCVLCGADAAADRSVRLDIDHIFSIARGGKTVPENLRTLCSRCNNGKGDLLT
jgi:hypothetical protein